MIVGLLVERTTEASPLLRNCGLRIGRERRISDRPAQKIERLFQCTVVLFVGRHVGLRAHFFSTFRLEVLAQRRLTLDVGLHLWIAGYFLEHLCVGLDALGLDGTAGRREVTCRGQSQRPIARSERHYRLHRAFAERAGADEGRALLILQRAGDDFRRPGRTAVDQEDNQLTHGQVTRPGVEALRLLGVAAACRDNLALVQEGIRDRNRLIEYCGLVASQNVAAYRTDAGRRTRVRCRMVNRIRGRCLTATAKTSGALSRLLPA
jgi:hypothetical protein